LACGGGFVLPPPFGSSARASSPLAATSITASATAARLDGHDMQDFIGSAPQDDESAGIGARIRTAHFSPDE
jgi:hypothetical protein